MAVVRPRACLLGVKKPHIWRWQRWWWCSDLEDCDRGAGKTPAAAYYAHILRRETFSCPGPWSGDQVDILRI